MIPRARQAIAAAMLLAAAVVPFSPVRAGTPPPIRLDLARAKDLPPGLSWVPEGPGGEPCLRIEVAPADAAGAHLFTAPIDIAPLRGREILLTYDVRAKDVTKPAHDYNGIKCQLHFVSASEGPQWFNESQQTGTFDWRHSALLIRIADDATNGEIQLGLQECSGAAWLANVTLTVVRDKPARPPRLRGVVGPTSLPSRLFEDLAAWKVNVIRWQLTNPDWPRDAVPSDPAVYGAWLEGRLDELSTALDQAKAAGIRVIIDLHTPPGGRLPDGTLRLTMDQRLQDDYVRVWEGIARRFRGHPALYAYDLMNEPLQLHPSPAGVGDWFAAQEAAARAVRLIDADTPILIEADGWDSPEAFTWMRPVWVPNVIYETHMYWPYEYTHQGVDRPWVTPEDRPAYPGTFNGRPLDRAALARRLAPVREFQRAYGARILVGEFSVARWAPGAAQYLTDCISLFEDYGWDWIYHAFRERSAWNLEHEDLPYTLEKVSPEPTDRARVVRGWFEKNERP
jgi:hypothetical protein